MARSTSDEELQLKKRARRRLVGAVVLATTVAVVLPMVLDTEPKPVSNNVNIQIPSPDAPASKSAVPGGDPAREAVGPAEPVAPPKTEAKDAAPAMKADAAPAAKGDAAPAKQAEAQTDAPAKAAEKPAAEASKATEKPAAEASKATEKPAAEATKATEKPAAEATKATEKPVATASKATEKPAAEAPKAAVKPAEKEAPKAEAKPPAKPAAKAETREAAKATAKPAAGGKFVVQIAALADAAKAKQLQQRVAGTGVKAYTEVVKTAKGSVTRVRAGPFDTREAAEKARGRLKGAGLDGKVVPR